MHAAALNDVYVCFKIAIIFLQYPIPTRVHLLIFDVDEGQLGAALFDPCAKSNNYAGLL